MLLSFFVALSRSEYADLTQENASLVIGGALPALIKFHAMGCGHCHVMADEFAEAATAFTDVFFGGVECGANEQLCEAHNISDFPTVLLFQAGSTTGIPFDSTRTMDSFCDFVENHTQIKAKRPPKYLTDLDPSNFDRQISSFSCVLVTFYSPWCSHSRHWIKAAKATAAALVGDSNVSLALSSCEEHRELCDKYQVDSYPTIKLFINETIVPFDDPRTAKRALAFINANCGTERALDGLLNDTAGQIPAAQPIVAHFVQQPSEALIEKMKLIPGSEFYVRVMERYLQGGKPQIAKDMATMRRILEERKGSWQSLDGMKRRLNVFTQFLSPPSPTPYPTIGPEVAARIEKYL